MVSDELTESAVSAGVRRMKPVIDSSNRSGKVEGLAVDWRIFEIPITILIEIKGHDFVHGDACEKVLIPWLRWCSEVSIQAFKPSISISHRRLSDCLGSAVDFILIIGLIAVDPMAPSFDSWFVHYNSFLIPVGLLIIV